MTIRVRTGSPKVSTEGSAVSCGKPAVRTVSKPSRRSTLSSEFMVSDSTRIVRRRSPEQPPRRRPRLMVVDADEIERAQARPARDELHHLDAALDEAGGGVADLRALGGHDRHAVDPRQRDPRQHPCGHLRVVRGHPPHRDLERLGEKCLALFLDPLDSGIETFKMLDLVVQLTGGGPGNTTTLTSIDLKRVAFEKWRTGYSSADAIILFVTVFGLATICVKALNKVKER